MISPTELAEHTNQVNKKALIEKGWNIETDSMYARREMKAYFKGVNELLNQLGMEELATEAIENINRGKYADYYLELVMNGSITLTFCTEDEAVNFRTSVVSKYKGIVSTTQSKDKLTVTATLKKELV